MQQHGGALAVRQVVEHAEDRIALSRRITVSEEGSAVAGCVRASCVRRLRAAVAAACVRSAVERPAGAMTRTNVLSDRGPVGRPRGVSRASRHLLHHILRRLAVAQNRDGSGVRRRRKATIGG